MIRGLLSKCEIRLQNGSVVFQVTINTFIKELLVLFIRIYSTNSSMSIFFFILMLILLEVIILSLGEQIRIQRKLHKFTQKELSNRLGLTAKMVSFYENDQRTPPIDILIKLSKIFSVSTDNLLELTSEKPENISMVNYSKTELSETEKIILKIFRKLNSDYKDIALGELKKCEKLQNYEKNMKKKDAKKEA